MKPLGLLTLLSGLLAGTTALRLTPQRSISFRGSISPHAVRRNGLLVMELQPGDPGYKRAKVKSKAKSFLRKVTGKDEKTATDTPTTPVAEVKAPTPPPAPPPPPPPPPPQN